MSSHVSGMRMLTITLTSDSWYGTKGQVFRFPFNSGNVADSLMLSAALCNMDIENYTAEFAQIEGPILPEQEWYDAFAYEKDGQLAVISINDAALIAVQCLTDIPVNV